MNPEHKGHQQSGPSRSQGNQGQTGDRPNPSAEPRNPSQNRPNQGDPHRSGPGGGNRREDEMNRERQGEKPTDADREG